MIHKADIWKNGSRTLFCLSDFHIVTQPSNLINNQQRHMLVQAAKGYGAHVIVEDSLRYFTLEPSGKQLYAVPHVRLMQLNPSQAALLGLSSMCYYAGVSVQNIEFRLGTTSVYREGYKISQVLMHTQEAVERIKSYDDGAVANAYYHELLHAYNHFSTGPVSSFLQNLREKGDQLVTRALLESVPYSEDIQTALQDLNPHFSWEKMDQYSQKVVLLMMFDSTLIDAEIVHALFEFPDKKITFVCAGNDHIERIAPVLERFGYTKTVSEGESLILQDVRYQEPAGISVAKLQSLFESKAATLPVGLRTSLCIQSLLDRKSLHAWINSFIYYAFLIAMVGFLSLFSWLGLSIALWTQLLIAALLSYGIVWYLGQPTRKRVKP